MTESNVHKKITLRGILENKGCPTAADNSLTWLMEVMYRVFGPRWPKFYGKMINQKFKGRGLSRPLRVPLQGGPCVIQQVVSGRFLCVYGAAVTFETEPSVLCPVFTLDNIRDEFHANLARRYVMLNFWGPDRCRLVPKPKEVL